MLALPNSWLAAISSLLIWRGLRSAPGISTGSPSGFHELSIESLRVAAGMSSKTGSRGRLADLSSKVSNVDFLSSSSVASIRGENLDSEVSSTELGSSSSTRFCLRDSKVGRVGM